MHETWRWIGAAVVAFTVALGVLIGASPGAAGEKPQQWTAESGLSEPKAIEKVPPSYPEEAKKERVQGAVVVEATIGTDGVVSDLKAIEDPDARLTAAALEAVARWRFEPARDAKGKAVAVRFTVTVNFKLS
jgi:TonB family protein